MISIELSAHEIKLTKGFDAVAFYVLLKYRLNITYKDAKVLQSILIGEHDEYTAAYHAGMAIKEMLNAQGANVKFVVLLGTNKDDATENKAREQAIKKHTKETVEKIEKLTGVAGIMYPEQLETIRRNVEKQLDSHTFNTDHLQWQKP